MLFDVALKYIAPITKALPSLSVDGSDAFAPKYRSSNESKDAAALVAELADDVADVAELPADVAAAAALVAELADDVADVAELPADVAAAAALVAAAAVEPNKVSV
tara:strand:- start:120 stop:437 length:318 start_codon:yes stop_codon:yes gene_type:complete